MFNVTFYTFSKKQKSTARPSGAGTVIPCIANTDFDILAPSICLNLDSYPGNYNYCYIPEFGRYYYSTFRFDAQTGLWWADCQVDALASWKTQLGALSGYVLRSAAEWDGTVIDTMYPMTATLTTETDMKESQWWDEDPENGTFVVGIVGSGATNYYYFTYGMLDLFFRYLLGDLYATDMLGVFALANFPELKLQINPLQYISSIIWIPKQFIGPETYANPLYIGGVDVHERVLAWPLLTTDGIITFETIYTIKRHPLASTVGEYLNVSAADYSIIVPPFGKMSLDPAFMANHNVLETMIQIDTRTGYAVLRIFGGPDAQHTPDLLINVRGQVGIPYQVGQVQAPGIGVGSLLPTIISGIGSVATGAATAGVAGAALGAVSAGLAAVGDVARSKIPVTNTVGGTPCVAALRGRETIFYEWRTPVEMDAPDKGRPLCQVKRLDTLPGYQLVGDIQLSIPCTETERSTISAAITSGYFYE